MAKNDEFYTLLKDIEAELKHYSFENKLVLNGKNKNIRIIIKRKNNNEP